MNSFAGRLDLTKANATRPEMAYSLGHSGVGCFLCFKTVLVQNVWYQNDFDLREHERDE